MRRLGFAGSLLVAMLIAPGPVAAAPPTSTLTVFAAASLSEAFTEIGRQMEHDQPGLRVRFNFAGSNQLALQVEQGARADVFASADQAWMDYLLERDRVGGAPQIFARNRLVVIVPRTNPARIGGLLDLAKRGVKLLLAAQAVPAGRYSREALQNLARLPGYGSDYPRRTLANLVSEEETVRGVVAKVQLGEADAGLCYRSDVTGPVARYVRVFEIPDSLNVLVTYPIATLKSVRSPDAAREFLERVLSATGQRTLARYGFIPATP